MPVAREEKGVGARMAVVLLDDGGGGLGQSCFVMACILQRSVKNHRSGGQDAYPWKEPARMRKSLLFSFARPVWNSLL